MAITNAITKHEVMTMDADWPKKDGRFLCTAERPRPQNADGRWAHTNVRDVGQCYQGCCDFKQCDDCGVRWRVEYGD